MASTVTELMMRRMGTKSGSAIDWKAEMTKLLDGSATTIIIPDTATSLRDNALRYCTALTSIHIPSNVVQIKEYAFYYCTSLTSVTYDGLPTIGRDTFAYCTAITDIRTVLPNGITSLTTELFARCSGLVNIIVPEGMTHIYSNAFYYCGNVETITYPSTITDIYGQEGLSFTKVTEVIINATTPPTLRHATASMGAHSLTFPIYVPDVAVNTYKNAGGNWANYSSRIKGISERPT